MSKEETLTAEKFQAEHYKDASCCSLRLWTNEMVEQYAQAKVLEALEKEVKQAFEMGKSELYHNERGLNINYATAEQYYETEVKPKYR
jgi:hypothetical protein